MSKRVQIVMSIAIGLVFVMFAQGDAIELELYGPYSYVVYSDKDDVFTRLRYALSRLSDQEFKRLLLQLLSSDNKCLLGKEACILHIYDENDTSYLAALKEVDTDFKRIGPDSVWRFKVAPNYYRVANLRNASVVYSLQAAIERLEHTISYGSTSP